MGSYILLSVSPFMIFYNLQALVLELCVFCFISECLLSSTQCSSISIKFLSPKKKKKNSSISIKFLLPIKKKKNAIRKLHFHLVLFHSFDTLSNNALPIYILNFCVICILHFQIKCLFEARDNLFQFMADTLWLLSLNNVLFVLPFVS